MLTREEAEKFAEANRRAIKIAEKGGTRPGLEPLTVAMATAAGVFGLLEIFAAITLPSLDRGLWPAIILTLMCTGGAAGVQWWREKAWLERWSAAIMSQGRAPDGYRNEVFTPKRRAVGRSAGR